MSNSSNSSNQSAISTTVIPYDQSVRISSHPTLSAQDIIPLDKYYILYWEARYLYTSHTFDRYDYYIKREGVNYRIIFFADASMEYIRDNPDHQVRLSFRRIKNRKDGIVLVSKIKGEQHESAS